MKTPDEKIIYALLTNSTNEAAAADCGLSRRQLYTRLKDPALREKMKETRERLLESATTRLQGHMDAAVQTMVDIMGDADVSAQTRLSASNAILSAGLKMSERVDLVSRLEELEATVKELEDGDA